MGFSISTSGREAEHPDRVRANKTKSAALFMAASVRPLRCRSKKGLKNRVKSLFLIRLFIERIKRKKHLEKEEVKLNENQTSTLSTSSASMVPS
jgi:hypothetical protein